MRYFLRLPLELKRVAVTAALMAPRIKRRLDTVGFEATTEWLNERARPALHDARRAEMTARIAQAAIARVPGTYNCLTRSVAVWWLLGGDPGATIRFGVGRDEEGPRLSFHAWVEKGGVVINDAADVADRYSPFSSPPPSTAGFD